MTFQVLDYKRDCVGYFQDQKIHLTREMPATGSTWEYSEQLSGTDYDIARIFAEGATLTDVCPPELMSDWERVKKSLRAYLRAFSTVSLSLEENCFYDAVPEFFLYEFLNIKNKITDHVVENYERPENYDQMIKLNWMVNDISARKLNIDIDPIAHMLSSVQGKNFLRTIQTNKWAADYNPWGTVTGRLSTNPKSFPILTMNKDYRACIKPQNDWFVELDFNAAELRVLLSLCGEEQPQKDIHDWNAETIFNNELSREEVKTQTFAWLYSSRSNKKLERIYNKDKVKNKYWDGQDVRTEFGRRIKDVDSRHALNYIIQSTTIDMVHEQAFKVFELLLGKQSFISLLIHDAIYIDLKDEEKQDIMKILHAFKGTRFGDMVVNVKAGKDLYNLKELNL